jgi:hypothetical protein
MHSHKLGLAALAIALTPVVAAAQPASPKSDCPEAVRGVDVALSPASDGVALVFTTPEKKQAKELTKLLREAGAMIEYHSKMAALHPELERPEFADDVVPPVDISITEVPKGAKVNIKVENPADRAGMVAQAKEFERTWQKNKCVTGAAKSPEVSQARR